MPEAKVPEELDPHTPANLVPLCAGCHKRVDGWSVARQLGAFAFDDAHRATVNDRITENLGPQYDHLSERQRAAFLERFDPADRTVTAVTDW